MDLPRLEDLPLRKGQRALVRVDLNVPLRDGVVEDDLRISTALPTINWLRERDAVVVIAGHLGRPKGAVDPQYSMAPVAARMSELLGCEVLLAPAVIGPRVEPLVASSSPGDVVMIENLRFEPGRDGRRSRVLHQPLRARRRVRERGVRGIAPGARVDRRSAAAPPARRRAVAAS